MEPTLPSKKDTKVSSFPRVLSSQELNQRLNIERQDSDFKERPGRGAQNDSATVSGVKAVEMAKELLHSRTSKTKFTGAAVDEDSSSDAHTPSANLTVSGVTGVQIANELNFAMAHPTHGPVLDNMSPNNTINKEADNQLVNRLQAELAQGPSHMREHALITRNKAKMHSLRIQEELGQLVMLAQSAEARGEKTHAEHLREHV
ncbi:hypothetical protein CYMTET_20624, partial [Cymbomonas tetramitiformis]